MKALLTRKIQFGKDKFKNGCLRIHLEFIEGLIARKKIIFEVNLGFNWKKLKFGARIIILKG